MVDAEAFYQQFSLQVGATDWRSPNPRHATLQLLVEERLRGRRDLRLLDVGCGAGVMSAHLRRHGTVAAIDFSAPAVALGRLLAPDVRFAAGSAAALPAEERFDVVTLFDVLEHIPTGERATVLAELAERLAEGGELILSTPHARFTDWLTREARELMQAIEEPVELSELIAFGDAHGLVLAFYDTYCIDFTGPQYQFAVLRRSEPAGAHVPALRARHAAAVRRRVHPVAGMARRLRLVAAACAARRWRVARWLLTGRGVPLD